MRKQSVKILIITVFMLSTPTGVAADEPVDAALACFSQAWNHHDMRAFGECFAADADFVNVTTHWWKGRAALEKNHAYLHGTLEATDGHGITVPQNSHAIFKSTTLTFTSSDVRYLRKDVAVVHAAWQITGDPRTPEPRSGLMTLILASDNGSWKIAAVQNTESNRNVRGSSDRFGSGFASLAACSAAVMALRDLDADEFACDIRRRGKSPSTKGDHNGIDKLWSQHDGWNKGKLVGQKAPFKLKEIWSIRIRPEFHGAIGNSPCLISVSTASYAPATC